MGFKEKMLKSLGDEFERNSVREKDVPCGRPSPQGERAFSDGSELFFKFCFVIFDARLVALQGLGPFLMTAAAGIGKNGRFWILFKHLEADDGLDDVKIVGMDVAGFGR